jgi:hypothetical protein
MGGDCQHRHVVGQATGHRTKTGATAANCAASAVEGLGMSSIWRSLGDRSIVLCWR